MEIEQYIAGFSPEGEAVVTYVMRATDGSSVSLANLGAAVTSVQVPDRNGRMADVLAGVGASAVRRPVRGMPGAVTGSRESLERAVWTSRVETDRVVFSLASPDGTDGYEGTLGLEIVYDWSDDLGLEITYLAKGDASTPVGLYSRLAFDLSAGEDSGRQTLVLAGREIPLGELPAQPVTLPGARPDTLTHAASLTDTVSGRTLDVYTTFPALRTVVLEAGPESPVRKGLILTGCETASGPQPLTAGDVYAYRTVWKFGRR